METSNLFSLVKDDTDAGVKYYRLKVPFGWLLKLEDSVNSSTSFELIADPYHNWEPVDDFSDKDT